MTRPWKFFVLALLLAPVLAWGVYRLAKELGFLDPPWNPEHEERRTIIAANSFQAATARLSNRLRRSVLPEGHVASDTRKLLLYYRCDHHNRLIMGGRGTFREPIGPTAYRHLETVIGLIFPQLKAVRCEFYWSGRVALTRDHLPHRIR